MTDMITPDLKTVLRRLRLSPVLGTLPERLSLAREHSIPHQDFLLLVLGDEVSRRDSEATALRARRARLDPSMRLEAWDATAKVAFDRALLNELVSMRFVQPSLSRDASTRAAVTVARWSRPSRPLV